MLAGAGVQQLLSGAASADTSAFELFCPDTVLGNVVFNDVVVSGTMSPAAPAPGQQFTLQGFEEKVPVPADVMSDAASFGITSITGSASASIAATGAIPTSVPTGALDFTGSIPNPVPASGGMLEIPQSPVSVGEFDATSTNVSLTLGSPVDLSFTGNEIPVGVANFVCSAYPNDVLPSGITQQVPPGLPLSPVIAFAGTPPPPPPPSGSGTGPYELYCPHTPVGDLVFNDVTTSATITSATLNAGDTFEVSNYQTVIPLPSGVVAAAVGLGNSSFDGIAASTVDAYGAGPAQLGTGSLGFDLPIPDPVSSSPLPLEIPTSPTTVGPFTALGGPITIAQDESILVVAELSSKAFKMSCTAYPNDSVAESGSTGTAPASTPIRPIIAVGSASGTTTTTITTLPGGPPGTGNETPGAPYELYCPGTPVGDIAVNDVVTTGSISPGALNEGDTFEVTNLQTQFTLPQNVVQDAENLGLTSLSGDIYMFLDVTGTEYSDIGYGYSSGGVGVVSVGSATTATTSASYSTPTTVPPPTGVSVPPYVPLPYPTPGAVDLSFEVTLPTPVPASGVQFTALPAAGSQPPSFVAAGGPIQVFTAGVNLNVSAFGDEFGLFCDTLSNDTVPTGLSAQEIDDAFYEPLIATASATTNPPPPAALGTEGPYELFCPQTPVGDIVLNDVTTTGTITPPDPAPGESFDLTGYQTTLQLPLSVAAAAQALGATDVSGDVTGEIDATGASPAQLPTGDLNFAAPLPESLPSEGVTLTAPSAPATVGPFTATAGAVTVAEDSEVSLEVTVAGVGLTLECTAYANDAEPSGLTTTLPSGSPMSPVIATTASGTSPTTAAASPPVATQADSGASGAGSGSGSSGSGSATSPSGEGSSGSGGSVSSASGSDSSATQASSASLAFTGEGSSIRWIALVGVSLFLLGLGLLVGSAVTRRVAWVPKGRCRPSRRAL